MKRIPLKPLVISASALCTLALATAVVVQEIPIQGGEQPEYVLEQRKKIVDAKTKTTGTKKRRLCGVIMYVHSVAVLVVKAAAKTTQKPPPLSFWGRDGEAAGSTRA